MDETRIIADLPQMTIEIKHGIDTQSGAEMVAVQLRAHPDFKSALPLLGGLTQFQPMSSPLDFWTQAMEMWTAPWRGLLEANPFFQGLVFHKK